MSARPYRRSASLAAISAILLLGGCKEDERAASPPRPVLAMEIKPKVSQVFGPFPGIVEPRYQSKLGFRTPGRIISRTGFVGDVVHKGQKLASLDRTLLGFALVQAKSDVVNAEAQLKNATAADARKRTLVQTEAVSQADVDAAGADLKTAAARLDQARAAAQKAQDQMGYADLEAEFDGVIVSWDTDVGKVVAAGASVVTIARLDARDAVVDIPDDLIDRLRDKDAFSVALQIADTVTCKGVVREIAPSADSATRTRRVRFTLVDPPEAFRLGSTINVAFDGNVAPRIEIPEAAILDRDGRATVWVVAKGAKAVSQRPVDIADRSGGRAVVTKGLAAGDHVVTAGIHSLKDGQAVNIATAFP